MLIINNKIKNNSRLVEQQAIDSATDFETKQYFEHKSSHSKFFSVYPELNNKLVIKNIKRYLKNAYVELIKLMVKCIF